MRRIATAVCAAASLVALSIPASAAADFGPSFSFGAPGSANGFFNHPQAAAVNFGNGQIYVADTGNGRIQRFDANGVWQGQFSGSAGFSPQDIAVDPTTGNVYVASPGKIEGFTSIGLGIPFATWNPSGQATGIAIDDSGDVWVSDATHSQIHHYGPLGQDKGAISGPGSAPGQVNGPRGLTIRSTSGVDQIFVADPSNSRIEAFDTNGNFLNQWAMPSYTINTGSTTINGTILPLDVAVDGSGRVFAPDAGTHSNFVAVFGSNGQLQQLFGAPDTDPNNACKVSAPWGVATSPSGRLYVVSTGESRVRVFDEAPPACPTPNFGVGGGTNPTPPGGGGGGLQGSGARTAPAITFTHFPRKRCVRKNFNFQIHTYDVDRIAQLVIQVNRRTVATQKPNEQFWNVKVRMPVRVLSRELPPGRSVKIVIVVKATDYAGDSATVSRAFRVCG
jgi:DNA-binding beta-propeller fold protein YncE